jgi:Na+/H+ antiporter NhaA
VINNAKLIILISSLIAGVIGYLFLKIVLTKEQAAETRD